MKTKYIEKKEGGPELHLLQQCSNYLLCDTLQHHMSPQKFEYTPSGRADVMRQKPLLTLLVYLRFIVVGVGLDKPHMCKRITLMTNLV